MAQLKHTSAFTFDPTAWPSKCRKDRDGHLTVTVGNNRTLTLYQDHTGTVQAVAGKLHGHTVAFFQPCHVNRITEITLDPCGYRTTTTRQAMQDFVEQFTGLRLGVSFAKGGFSARFLNEDLEENALGLIGISSPGLPSTGRTSGCDGVPMHVDLRRAAA